MKKKMRRAWRQVTADKKKFGIFVTVLAIGLLLWGRLILLEDVPRVATADPNSQAQPGAVVQNQAAIQPVNAAVLPPIPRIEVDLTEQLSLDLFAFRHNRYSLRPREDIGSNRVQPGDGADDEQVRKAQLVEEARDLRLQSVIYGKRPAIVVNGRVLRVGDSIDGFEIASFDKRSANVTRDGLTLTITMLSN